MQFTKLMKLAPPLLGSFTLAANAVCEAGHLSSELAILAVAFVFSQCDKEQAMTKALAENLKHVWYFAELSLFFLIGAELDVSQVGQDHCYIGRNMF